MTDLSDQVAAIDHWDRSRCAYAWHGLTGAPPHSGLSIGFLRRALAFELQCKELNGHSAAVKRQLRGMRTDRRANGQVVAKKSKLSLGTQLVREWNGRIYRILVTEDGFEMDGTAFRSLSAVAKYITGAEWSGPRFFGLYKR